MVGQFILTNAAQQQLIEGRQRNSAQAAPHFTNDTNEINFLMEALNKIQNELNNLKNK